MGRGLGGVRRWAASREKRRDMEEEMERGRGSGVYGGGRPGERDVEGEGARAGKGRGSLGIFEGVFWS